MVLKTFFLIISLVLLTSFSANFHAQANTRDSETAARFADFQACQNGETIRSEIRIVHDSFFLYRQNCQATEPILLSRYKPQLIDQYTLIYEDIEYQRVK